MSTAASPARRFDSTQDNNFWLTPDPKVVKSCCVFESDNDVVQVDMTDRPNVWAQSGEHTALMTDFAALSEGMRIHRADCYIQIDRRTRCLRRGLASRCFLCFVSCEEQKRVVVRTLAVVPIYDDCKH